MTLLAVPMVIRELGPEQYGVYVSLAALVAVMLAVDLGLGNALVNEIASLGQPHDQRERVSTLVSSAIIPIVVASVLLVAGLFCLTQVVDLTRLLNTPDTLTRAEVNRLVLLAFVPYLLSLPLGVVVRIRYGLQEGHVSHLLQVAGYGLQFLLLGIAALRGAGLPWFVVLLGAGALFGYLLDVIVMVIRRPWIVPRPSRFAWDDAQRLVGVGGLFLVLGLSAAVGYQTDAIVIAHYLGPSEAAVYGATFQLIAVCPVVLSLFLMPLWPAYGEAAARGDGPWIRSSFRRSLQLSISIAVLASLVVVVAGPWLVEQWAGPSVRPPESLVLAGGAFIIVNAISGPFAMLMNGLRVLRPQAVVGVLMALANIALSIYLVQVQGLAGPLFATAATQLLIVLVPMGLYIRRMMTSGFVPSGAPELIS